MFSYDDLKNSLSEIQTRLNIEFNDPKLLLLAFVHSSYVNENRHLIQEHNERLEFLGDAVLGLLVSDYLYQKLPSFSEGRLSTLRACLVCSSVCVQFVKQLKLGKYMVLGKGENLLERGRETILADLFEALIGVIYLDQGLEKAKQFLLDHFSEKIQEIIQTPQENFKAELQNMTQKNSGKMPEYKILKESGPDHDKQFVVGVFLDGKELALGTGPNRKEAEQKAAQKALSQWQKS